MAWLKAQCLWLMFMAAWATLGPSVPAIGQPACLDSSQLPQQQTPQQVSATFESKSNSIPAGTWDFSGAPRGAIAASGPSFTLSCVHAINVALAPPGGPVFLAPLALGLGPATSLELSAVALDTDCATLEAYQRHLCERLALPLGASVQLLPGRLEVSRWSDACTLVADTNVTCTPDQPGAAPPPPPCNLISACNAPQLAAAFMRYQRSLDAPITLVMTNNITFSAADAMAAAGGPVPIVHNVSLLGSRQLSAAVLDLNNDVELFALDPGVTVTVRHMIGVNLAPCYVDPRLPYSHFQQMTQRLWAFDREVPALLEGFDSTMVLSPDVLEYFKYWVTFRSSPVPEARAKANWLLVYDFAIANISDEGVLVRRISSYTINYSNVLYTDKLAGYSRLLPQDLALRQFIDDPVPLNAVSLADSEPDFVTVMQPNITKPDDSGRRFVLLWSNFTVGTDQWPANVTTPPGTLILGRGPGAVPKRLSFNLRSGVLLNVGSDTPSLTLREMVLSGLPALTDAYSPEVPLQALAVPLWPLGVVGGGRRLRLNNVTLLVNQQELDLLLVALVPGLEAAVAAGNATIGVPADGQQQHPQRPQVPDPLLVAAVRSFFAASSAAPLQVADHGPAHLLLAHGATARYSLTNVLIRTPDPAYGEVAGPSLTALGVPYGPPPGHHTGSGNFPTWAIGVIVGVLSGIILAAMVGLALWWRRRIGNGTTADSQHDLLGWAKGLMCSLTRRGTSSSLPTTGSSRAGSPSQMPPSSSAQAATPCLVPGLHVLQQPSSSATAAYKALAPASLVGGSEATAAEPRTATTGGATPLPATTFDDSFDLPPNTATFGGIGAGAGGVRLAGPAAAPHSSQQQQQQQQGSQPSRAGRRHSMYTLAGLAGGPVTGQGTSQQPAGWGSGSELTRTAGGGSGFEALDTMHALINNMGREFGESQLQVSTLLGKGASGTVYRGKWRGLPVAIKSMVFGGNDPEGAGSISQQRPLLEAAISSNLAHPNIVTTYAYELLEVPHEFAAMNPELARQGGGWRLCLIQEYCDAGPLKQLVDGGHFASPATLPSVVYGIRPLQQQPQPQPAEETPPSPFIAPAQLVQEITVARDAAQPAAARQPQQVQQPHELSCLRPRRSLTAPLGLARLLQGGKPPGIPGSPRSSGGGMLAAAPARAAGAQQLSPSTDPGVGYAPAPAQQQAVLGVPLPPLDPGINHPASVEQAAARYTAAALMVARGLAHIHAKNIVHGDLNCSNVLLSRRRSGKNDELAITLGFVCKVADFGLSVRVQEDQSHLSNLFQGTPYYIAPEVVMSGRVSKAADMYALGIMMWEMQHGERPPWRRGRRLPTFPLLNTGQLAFRSDCPHAYVALARRCFHGSREARPTSEEVVSEMEAMAAARARGAEPGGLLLCGGGGARPSTSRAQAAKNRRASVSTGETQVHLCYPLPATSTSV